ncbi:MAG: hypothetical protein GY716_02245 [bacterium]|nr:hypothetical protein [bacterium]
MTDETVCGAPGVGMTTQSESRRRLLPGPIVLGCLLLLSLAGARYYAEPIAERVRDPLHAWLKPSGYVGQSAGILTLLLFLFMWLYPLRKRVRVLASAGRLSRWLDVHIAVGLILPVLGAVHAAWRFNGLIGVGYAAMLLVSLSGIVGRYLYTHIPRGRSGIELSLNEVETQRRRLAQDVAALSGLEASVVDAELSDAVSVRGSKSLAGILVSLLSQDVARWRAARRLRLRLARRSSTRPLDRRTLKRVARLARKQIALTQQMTMLDATHRIFRFWHVAHLPFAVTAFLAVTIHVGVAIGVGMTWFW